VPPPRIDEASVVAPHPLEAPAGDIDLALPVVDSKGAMPVAPPARPPAPAPAPRAVAATQFLPGSATRPLVFDVPEKSVSPFEIELGPAPMRPPAHTLLGVSGPGAAAIAPPPPPPPPSPPSRTPTIPGAAAPAVRPRQETVRFEGSKAAPAPRPPRTSPLLIDVTPLSLGVETVGGFCDPLIDANTPVPCDRTRTFATATDGQTMVHVRVSQGESRRFAENTCLGQLELTGIAAGPRGSQEIAVTFEIDADGILNVRARDVATGKETKARMQLVGGQGEPGDLAAMQARQAAHPLAPLDTRD
jgi:molecular chaperone DnaK